MEPEQLRILVIDDNPGIHQDFKKILNIGQREDLMESLEKKLTGKMEDTYFDREHADWPIFSIDSAFQGEEGFIRIQNALNENRPYALAFVDIQMPPGWDGIKTIKRIWELDKCIQIVICTAHSDYTWEETVSELGLSDSLLILKKPFDSIAVRQLACALTKKWQLMQESKLHTESLENTVLERTHLLQRSLSLTRATLESSYDGIAVVNNHAELIDCNNNFTKMWSIPASLVSSKKFNNIQKHISRQLANQDIFTTLLQYFENKPYASKFSILKLENGSFFECYSQAQYLDGTPTGRVWSFRDITPRVELENKLQHQATHDTLTALPNRALLIERIEQGIELAQRVNRQFVLMFIDLDRFKLINDSFSHEAGDALLVELASRLCSVTRTGDTIARLSGDEFILLSLSCNPERDIDALASRILSNISTEITIKDKKISITGSIGIAKYPNDGSSSFELLKNADFAMYRAKALGGNQYHFYNSELNRKSLKRLEGETALRKALLNNEFFLVYQPQFNVVTKKIIAVEALIRWNHPTKGIVLPINFIPLAEESSLIVPIGEWVMRTACAYNKSCQDKGLPCFPIAINVATKQLMQPNFTKLIQEVLQETGLSPQYLEIEVTENVIISNINVRETIQSLKETGVQIVLDDFGTGNSGLNYLRGLPIDRLKIDKTFVQNIDVNHSDEVIIQAIIAMADSLNLDVIAEGVETQQQLAFLEDRHCEKFQGYYFSKPISSDELVQLIGNQQ